MMGIKRPGGFAEMVAVPACAAIELPDGLDFHHAAVMMRHVPTAWNLLVNVGGLKAGETVLIMGAGGNLGSIGIQIAKNVIGANVIAAAGSDDRVKIGLALGADHGLNYNTVDLQAEVMKLTGGKGVDVLYDNIANPKVLPNAFRAIGFDGRLVTAGAHAGPDVTIDFSHLYHKRITIKGTAGLSCLRCGKMLCRRCRRQDQGADRADSAAVARRRRASAGGKRRVRGQDRARPDAWDSARPLVPHCAGREGMPIFHPLPSSPMTPGFAREGGRSTEEI